MRTMPLTPPLTAFERSVQTAFQLVQIPDAGPTRPTLNLVQGQQFFDLRLGKPVWWTGTRWVDAVGSPV